MIRSGAKADSAALAKRLAHRFAAPDLLLRALTHRSYSADHNERLEFLGDAVLNLAVADLLFEQLPDLPEGDLSRMRANLVKQDSLHPLAVQLGLPDLLRLGEGELRTGGAHKPSVLADALEAVIGAVYVDAGHDAARALVRRLFAQVEIKPSMGAAAKDAKTALQEWLQARKLAVPQYGVTAITGAAHAQTFTVCCEVPALKLAESGEGRSRRAAEQEAAARMLSVLASRLSGANSHE